MRLIDADELPRFGHRGGLVHWKDIKNAPTIDAVEVVRCKDCRWFKKWKTIGRDDGYCGYARMTRDGLQYINTNADDFCSYGEREGE